MKATVNLIDGVLALGRRYQDIGRQRDAVSLLVRLCRFRSLPAEAAEEAQTRLAEIHLKNRKYKQARRHLTAALRHQPDNARYHYLLATALRADEGEDLQRAAEHYGRALELDPGHAHCRADYGLLLLKLGQTDNGLAQLRQAVEGAADDMELLGKWIKGLRQAGRYDEALSHLHKARFRHGHSPRFRRLYDEFRFQHARRRAAERMQSAANETEGETPVLLPFVRLWYGDRPA